MKILVALDGSRFSDAALREVIALPWPPETQVRLVSVIHAVPFVPEPTLTGVGIHYYSLDQEQKRAHHALKAATRALADRAPQLRVTCCADVEGSPASHIVDEAKRFGADLIVIGSHGHGFAARMVLGSVSHAVVLHAPCSVLVVRDRSAAEAGASAKA